jgi:hypothetical protein
MFAVRWDYEAEAAARYANAGDDDPLLEFEGPWKSRSLGTQRR